MIAVDTSALMAILLNEPDAAACASVLERETEILISAATVAEAMIVAFHRNIAAEMRRLIEGLGFQIVSVTPASAYRTAEAYSRYGKGMHEAGLNFGDCFAYALAETHACPLLFVGRDFARTGITRAL